MIHNQLLIQGQKGYHNASQLFIHGDMTPSIIHIFCPLAYQMCPVNNSSRWMTSRSSKRRKCANIGKVIRSSKWRAFLESSMCFFYPCREYFIHNLRTPFTSRSFIINCSSKIIRVIIIHHNFPFHEDMTSSMFNIFCP